MTKREAFLRKVDEASIRILRDKNNSKAAKIAAGLSLAQDYTPDSMTTRVLAAASKVERPRENPVAESG